jgi:hypothetical protein
MSATTSADTEERARAIFARLFDERDLTDPAWYDGATFARQVGMLPTAGSAADRATLAAFNAAARLRRRVKR